MPKLQSLLKLALITGARIGELLTLRWEDCQEGLSWVSVPSAWTTTPVMIPM